MPCIESEYIVGKANSTVRYLMSVVEGSQEVLMHHFWKSRESNPGRNFPGWLYVRSGMTFFMEEFLVTLGSL